MGRLKKSYRISNAELLVYLGFFKTFIKVFNNNIVDGLNGETVHISRCLIAWGNGTYVIR